LETELYLDEQLPTEIPKVWQTIARDLNDGMNCRTAKFFFRDSAADDNLTFEDKSTLNVFVDSSTNSYGAVAYIMNEKASTLDLVIFDNRVASLKKITLPRHELMAAVIGARLSRHLQSVLKCYDVIIWSDSQIVMHWLEEKKQLPRFVKNQVQEINELTEIVNGNAAQLTKPRRPSHTRHFY
jgi:hypothetical protein